MHEVSIGPLVVRRDSASKPLPQLGHSHWFPSEPRSGLVLAPTDIGMRLTGGPGTAHSGSRLPEAVRLVRWLRASRDHRLHGLGVTPTARWGAVSELASALLLTLGLSTGAGAAAVVAAMLTAAAPTHWPRLWTTENRFEYTLVLGIAAAALGLIGPRYVVVGCRSGPDGPPAAPVPGRTWSRRAGHRHRVGHPRPCGARAGLTAGEPEPLRPAACAAGLR